MMLLDSACIVARNSQILIPPIVSVATPQPTAPAKTATQQARVGDFELRHAWLEPLDTPAADAAQLSLPGTPAPTWPKIALPATVFAGWLQQHPDVDPFFGDNFRKLPGVNFPVATNYSYLDIPEESPFYRPSIYLLPFELPELDDDRRVRLHVKGINYRANIWLNGTSVGSEASEEKEVWIRLEEGLLLW